MNGHIVSGAELVTLSILDELKSRDYIISCVINGWGNDKLSEMLSIRNIPFQRIKLGFFYLSKPIWTLDTIKNLPAAYRALSKVIKTFHPDICYYTGFRPLVSAYPLLRKKKNIVHIHDAFHGVQSRIYLAIINPIVAKYIAVSESIRLNMIRHGAVESKIAVIRNGVKSVPVLGEMQYKSDIIRIGIIGRIDRSKGHDILLDSLAIVKAKSDNFQLLIFGEGNPQYKSELINRAKRLGLQDHIAWHGFQDDKAQIYKQLDLIVVPSKNADPLPTTAIEAGQYGKACIGTSVGGLPEIVINHVTGFIIPAASPSALAEKVIALLTNKDLLEEMGQSAHANIANNFRLADQIGRIEQIFETTVL
jgi:glycosyltransferase involved in cell wall biosynthesis